VLLSLAPSCAPKTSTTQTWSAELPAHGRLESVLVVGTGSGVVERRQLEDALVEDLSKRGVLATPSYRLFPDVPDHEQARDVALRAGIDGILTSRLRSVQVRKRYVAASETYFAQPEYGSYSRSSAGYYVNDEVAEFETTLWEPQDGMKLWTAVTRTDNAASGKSLSGSLANAVLPGLEKAGLVGGER